MPDTCVLAGVGGCIDAIGVLTLGHLFVSHMSGNTAFLGASFGQGNWLAGMPSLVAIPIFVVGLFLGYFLMASIPTPRQCARVLVVEAALLTIFWGMLFFGAAKEFGSWLYYLTITPPILAMGLQNTTLRQVGRSVFPSTYVTGVLDTFAKSVAQTIVIRRHEKVARALPSHLDPLSPLVARRALSVWFSYAGGALVGSAGLLVLKIGILVVPIIALLVLAVALFRSEE